MNPAMKKDLKNAFKGWLSYVLVCTPITGVLALLDTSPAALIVVMKSYLLFIFGLPLAVVGAAVMLFIGAWFYVEVLGGELVKRA